MMRQLSPVFAGLVLFGACSSAQLPANLPPFSTFLKADSTVQQVATDAQGYIYVFGEVTPESRLGVFVARLNPSATETTYVTVLKSRGGTGITVASAMAVDAAGNAYITGYTGASDFPTLPSTPGPASPDSYVPFAAKLNTAGAIVYSTLFSNGVYATPQAIVVDHQGDAIVSGSSSRRGLSLHARSL